MTLPSLSNKKHNEYYCACDKCASKVKLINKPSPYLVRVLQSDSFAFKKNEINLITIEPLAMSGENFTLALALHMASGDLFLENFSFKEPLKVYYIYNKVFSNAPAHIHILKNTYEELNLTKISQNFTLIPHPGFPINEPFTNQFADKLKYEIASLKLKTVVLFFDIEFSDNAEIAKTIIDSIINVKQRLHNELKDLEITIILKEIHTSKQIIENLLIPIAKTIIRFSDTTSIYETKLTFPITNSTIASVIIGRNPYDNKLTLSNFKTVHTKNNRPLVQDAIAPIKEVSEIINVIKKLLLSEAKAGRFYHPNAFAKQFMSTNGLPGRGTLYEMIRELVNNNTLKETSKRSRINCIGNVMPAEYKKELKDDK